MVRVNGSEQHDHGVGVKGSEQHDHGHGKGVSICWNKRHNGEGKGSASAGRTRPW